MVQVCRGVKKLDRDLQDELENHSLVRRMSSGLKNSLRFSPREYAIAAYQDFGIKSLIIGGGVSANSRLRADAEAWAGDNNVALHIPVMKYCLDNAAMIAGLGCLRFDHGDIDTLALAATPARSL